MADARRMGKMELFAHFADKFDMKRTQVRDLFEELLALSEKELKRSGEFVIPGVCKLVVQRRKAREGRNPATGEPIKIPAKTVVKARIAKALKDAVLPRKSVPFRRPVMTGALPPVVSGQQRAAAGSARLRPQYTCSAWLISSMLS